MDKSTQQELITRYALNRDELNDAEDTAAWAEFAADLADSPELQAELAAFQTAAQSIAYSVEPATMSADLHDRLMAKISQSRQIEVVGNVSASLTQLLDIPLTQLQQVADSLENWEAFPAPAIGEMAIWQLDEATNQVAFFVRSAVSGPFPNHYHAAGETVLVVDGDFGGDEHTYRSGDIVYAAAETSHQPYTKAGCLVFCISSMDDKILEP
ncbi:cupin domain-containing protein [filamentous cyanobacterium LEGE 11480]|uniref:Cupin domain-containing protein n=1 Tax=Romeriopsis navalis LEGE 11480 TaxID=2777977 RepID=A0A928Z506_9CYAN|nr:cupin domain-containing protein [Romeriopsis navalis]MBE9031562.1 cupin domain-containing protein [Romeriopsis navalis LEGE 11480]